MKEIQNIAGFSLGPYTDKNGKPVLRQNVKSMKDALPAFTGADIETISSQ